jgi:hypothetical protein
MSRPHDRAVIETLLISWAILSAVAVAALCRAAAAGDRLGDQRG